MSYTGKFIASRGQDCIIHRSPTVETRVSKKRSTKASRDLGIREGYWEGLALSKVNLLSGEIITIHEGIKQVKYLVQSTNYDPQSMETAFFAAKCNITFRHLRYVDDVDENFNPIQGWDDVDENNIYIDSYGEVITSRMRQSDPGLLEGTIYVIQVPKSLNALKMDRVRFNDENYQIVSIDDIGMSGISRLQLAKDFRT